MDVEGVYAATKHAVETLREGPGPALIECFTYRFVGHHEGDSRFYRTDEEEEELEARDPVETYPEKLIDEGFLTADEFKDTQQEIEAEIDEAIEFARDSEFPEPSAAYEGLFSNDSEEI